MSESVRQRLWIDITDLWYWKGTFTGIQNVVDRYTQMYADNPDVHFFLFEPEHQVFREVNKPEWAIQRKAILACHEGQSEVQPVRSLRLTARHYAVMTAKWITPKPVKQKAYAKLVSYREKRRGYKAQHTHPFKDGDTILVIGGNWGDDFIGFMEGLVRIRHKLNIKLLHVVHDIIPLRYPNYFAPGTSFARYFSEAAKGVDGYICISQSTAKDLQRFLQTVPHKDGVGVNTFRLGEDFPTVSKPQKPPLALDDKFILCVGTIESRKNQALIYNAVKLALEKGITIPQIVIAGRVGWMAAETLRNLTVDPDVRGKIVVSHTVTDEQKAWLFSHCLFTIYPSFYEGWGLPVVESFYNGKLCLCSNAASLAEAGADYADYFSPFDASDLLRLMTVYTDSKKRRMKESVLAKRPHFTWDMSFADFSKEVDRLIRHNA